MSDSQQHDGREVSRRRFLAMGGSLAAASALGPLVDPLAAFGAPAKWPKARLTARDAVTVDRSQFMPVSQFRSWHAALEKIGPANQRGLRATGSAATEGYIDDLVEDLGRAGVRQVHTDPIPMRRWSTATWGLDLVGGPAPGPVKTASYIPYSGRTPAAGVTGPLVWVDSANLPAPGSLAGKIAVFDVPITILTYGTFGLLEYKNGRYDPKGRLDEAGVYKRPYQNNVVPVLTALQAAGAAGVVGILDFPANGADGSYFPYDGEIRAVPGLYVDRTVGAALRDRAKAADSQATLKLPAEVKATTSRNVIGFIPGRSKELVALHCHTDGSNAIEDNGPGAIVAIAQYLARLPKSALPRTIMVVLTTGHFAGGNGSRGFVTRHEDDLVKRTNAAITIEHLGLRQWEETTPGRMGPTGRMESGAIFTPDSPALVEASRAMFKRAATTTGSVLKPLNPKSDGDPNAAAWPGEGQYLFGKGGIQTANYITGPTYLLNWGITTTDKVSFDAVRAEAIAFTEMILRLGRAPRAKLRATGAR